MFRALWLASLASNLGTWLQNVGAGWLMTGLTPSPLMAALVQAATLPVFLLALFLPGAGPRRAGVFGDYRDHVKPTAAPRQPRRKRRRRPSAEDDRASFE